MKEDIVRACEAKEINVKIEVTIFCAYTDKKSDLCPTCRPLVSSLPPRIPVYVLGPQSPVVTNKIVPSCFYSAKP